MARATPAALGDGPGSGAVLRSSVAKNPPMSWSWGISRMHRSSGGPLIRFPSLVTPLAFGGHMDFSKVRRKPTETASAWLSSNVGYSTTSSSTIVITFQLDIPGRRRKSRTRSEASTISNAPPHRRTSSATTASFSTGLKLHVLYTMYPPTRNSATPRCAMRSCRPCSPMANSGRHSLQICGFLRSVPSPLHGTSQMMRSNEPSGYLPRLPPSARSRSAGPAVGVPSFGGHSNAPPGAAEVDVVASGVNGTSAFGNHCA